MPTDDAPALAPPSPGAVVAASPFLCDADTALPAGWVRGDAASDAGPTMRIAHDPRRHTVVRCVGDVSAATVECLSQAGFEALAVPGEPVTFYLRDRLALARRVEAPQRAASRPAGRSR